MLKLIFLKLFLATSENLNSSSFLTITKNPQLDNIKSDFIQFLLESLVFTIFSGITLNHIVLILYYHLPFLSNIEAQVKILCQLFNYIDTRCCQPIDQFFFIKDMVLIVF